MTEGRPVLLFRLCLVRLHRISPPFISSVHCPPRPHSLTALSLSLKPFSIPFVRPQNTYPFFPPSLLPSFPPSLFPSFPLSLLPSLLPSAKISLPLSLRTLILIPYIHTYIHTFIHCRSIPHIYQKTLFHHTSTERTHHTTSPSDFHIKEFSKRTNTIQYNINHAHRNTRSVTARQPAQERQAHPHLHCPRSGRHLAVDRDCVFLAPTSQASTGEGGVGVDFGRR